MRRVLVLILVTGLLAGCGLDGKSEADQLHELRVAATEGGGSFTRAAVPTTAARAFPTGRKVLESDPTAETVSLA